MNKNQIIDILRINDAMYLLSDITLMAGLGEPIKLGRLSCLMWLCADKLDQIMTEVEAESEQTEKDKKKGIKPI